MIVQEEETIVIDNEHSIEFGFDLLGGEEVEVIRRRKNREDGTYDPISSSIIPINSGFIDIDRLFMECLRRDRIDIEEMIDIRNEIEASIIRQSR